MSRSYIDIPSYTFFEDIIAKKYSLSASQYKIFNIANKNQKSVAEFLERGICRGDLGIEVGSNNYVEKSPYVFIKTKALQKEHFILDESRDSFEFVLPQVFYDMKFKKGDVLISKDSNVGEVVILDKDYPKAMVCSGIYRLPIKENKYYLLGFIKSDLFRQQIDFLVPKGATIKHGKTKFLECMIPIPNNNRENVINYVEILVQAIINKEIAIRNKYQLIMQQIEFELEDNQAENKFIYSQPSIAEIMELDRMDSSLYSQKFKRKEFLIKNYKRGTSTIFDLGFKISRGQNLQVSNIGKSIQTTNARDGYYTLILPKFLSKYGTVSYYEYIGNKNELKTLKKGDIIFGAEGNEKGRSLVVTEDNLNAITNIHGITLNHENDDDLVKSVFVKLFLDYMRMKGMIDEYAVGSNGGSLAIKYWSIIPFPNFDENIERDVVKKYYNPDAIYNPTEHDIYTFLEYDNIFNENAGICEIDKSMKYLKKLLKEAIQNIADDQDVQICF